jgi:UDP-N-acetylglucosamine 2-epimerase (non-hydrolysing)
LERLQLSPRAYAVCTLHRPSNVDDPAVSSGLISAILDIAERLPVAFPVHPRTRKTLVDAGLLNKLEDNPQVRLIEPMGYLEFLSLTAQAKLILTDSGGLQEESTALGVPCLTLRENTERPITVTEGTNRVVGTDPERICAEANAILSGETRKGRIPEGWDGRSGERIAQIYAEFLIDNVGASAA